MALVEAVAGELGDLFKDQRRLGLGHAAGHRALDEGPALGLHLGLDLLAHGPAQQVRTAQTVASQFLGDLHDLFLVDHDPVRLFQDPFQARVEVVRRLLFMLAGDVAGDVVHRARAVERHDGDDILEAVRPEPAQDVAHARGLQLENPNRVAAAQHLIGRSIVQRHVLEVEAGVVATDEIARARQHRQRLEPKEIELHQPGLLHVFHAELGGGHVRARVAVERDQLLQRPVADHDARGMGRGVAVKALELQRDVDQAGDRLVVRPRLLELRFALDGLAQVDRVRRVVGDELAQPVHLGIGHLQHAPHVAQGGTRLQLAEGDDLGHVIPAVLGLDVADDLVAPVLAEIDVEIGHRYALGVEEALE